MGQKTRDATPAGRSPRAACAHALRPGKARVDRNPLSLHKAGKVHPADQLHVGGG